MFQLDLFSMRCLDYFSLVVLNNYSVCLLCSVSSVPSIFLVTQAKFVVSRYRCPPKALAEILPFKLLQYRRKRNPLRDSTSNHFFQSFLSVAESFCGVAMVLLHVYAHVHNRSLLLLVSVRRARKVRIQ